jgi:hypothetical protein
MKGITMSKSERRAYDVTPTRFIEAWESSETVSEVSTKLGMPGPIVHSRAAYYRKQGVKLKKFQSRSKKLDVDSLNQKIEQLDKMSDQK